MADGNGEGLVVRMKEPNRKDPDEMFDWVVERLQREWYPTEEMTIKQMINAFNGGTNRAEYYFPLLYYPLKVLESKGLIKYLGRGGIIKK